MFASINVCIQDSVGGGLDMLKIFTKIKYLKTIL